MGARRFELRTRVFVCPPDEASSKTSAAITFAPFGTACESDSQCGANGRCDDEDAVCVCQPLYTVCGGTCVDLLNDASHCGGCDGTCAANQVCDHGMCAGSKTTDPPRPIAVGAACGASSTCAYGSSCVAGTCTCDAGKTPCNGGCVDLANDWRSCGSCGAICREACSEGRCVKASALPRGAPSTARPTDAPTLSIKDVSPDASSTCRHEVEVYPERSVNHTSVLFAPYTWHAGGDSSHVLHDNFTDAGVWSTDDTLQVPGQTGYCPAADSWAATSSSEGLEVFINAAHDGCTSYSHTWPAIGATTVANMGGTWD